jgi:hypothetical protein
VARVSSGRYDGTLEMNRMNMRAMESERNSDGALVRGARWTRRLGRSLNRRAMSRICCVTVDQQATWYHDLRTNEHDAFQHDHHGEKNDSTLISVHLKAQSRNSNLILLVWSSLQPCY